MERTLTDLVALAKVLYQEEQKAFHAAMEEDTDRSVGLMLQAAVWASIRGLGLAPGPYMTRQRSVGAAYNNRANHVERGVPLLEK